MTMTLDWRSWGLVGSMGWSMKTSNIKWCWGLVLPTHIGLCSVRVNPPTTTTTSISRPLNKSNQSKPTTTKYKCRPSLVHSHSSLISSSIINNHQQLVWNDDPLSFRVLGFWVDWIGLMNRLNQSKIVFSVMMMIECDCQWWWWWWRMYSNNNNHNQPPRLWLVTLSQTLIDSNTQSPIPLSLSIDISLWSNNIQKRKMLMMITNIKIDLDLSLVSVIVLVPSTRFKQSSRSNNELCK